MTNGRDERRLAAILAMDVVGFSRLMGADESGTLGALRALREELWDPRIEEFGGRVFKTTGDGQLAEFGSVIGAVECAVDIQRAMVERDADIPKDKRIVLRIGINQSDVIVEGDDIYGDGVNIAARLEALSQPAGICVSRNVRDLIRDKLPYPLEDLGEVEVKNIARPVRAFQVLYEDVAHTPVPPAKAANGNVRPRWLLPSIAAAVLAAAVLGAGTALWQPWVTRVETVAVADMALPLPDKPSIAVLPFVNLTGNAADEFLPDGMSEDITTALGSLPRLFVISRTTTSIYKGKPVTAKQVAEELGVRFILEGSVQRSGDTIRVTAQLIDAIDGRHVWAENYDRGIEDLFAVKDEIVLSIAANVSGELDSGETDKIARSGTGSLKAWTLWKQGSAAFVKLNAADNAKARDLAEQAIEADPGFAAAFALLAGSYDLAARFGTEPHGQALDTALSHVNEALRLDGGNVYAYVSLAGIRQAQGDLDLALEAAEKATALGPNDFSAQGMLAMTLNAVGRFREAISHANLAMRLSPNYPAWIPSVLADAHLALGEFTLAEEALNLKLDRETSPQFAWDGRIKLALVYAGTDREQEARQAIAKAREAYPSGTISASRGTTTFQNTAILDGWSRTWRRLGVPEVLEVSAVRDQDRVRGAELSGLVASPWWYGAGARGSAAHWAIIAKREIEFNGPWAGPSGKIRGPMTIENDHICGDFGVLGKFCAAYYRNPGGTHDGNNEYIVVGPSGVFPFSVYQTRPPALEAK